MRSVNPLASGCRACRRRRRSAPVSSGRPAASSEPKVIVSTSSATTTPSTSPIGGSLRDRRGGAAVLDLRRRVRRGGAAAIASVCVARDVRLGERELQVGVGDPAVLGDDRRGRGGDVRHGRELLDRGAPWRLRRAWRRARTPRGRWRRRRWPAGRPARSARSPRCDSVPGHLELVRERALERDREAAEHDEAEQPARPARGVGGGRRRRRGVAAVEPCQCRSSRKYITVQNYHVWHPCYRPQQTLT